MDSSVKYQFLMSQLTHIQEIRETERTKLSLVLYREDQATCVLRVCKDRDLSSVCDSLRKIRNPNTAVVYDYVFYEGDTYILEEKLNGKTVQEYLDEGRTFSEKETARIAVAVCNALEEFHKETPPVVHNDINPSNIMLLDDGSVKLFDFDVARLYKNGAEQNTMLFGTEEYASPEHYGYGQSEPRTDIYCLGATMHKMLTGEKLSTEHRITYKGKLQNVLKRCLRLDPQNRYATVKALRKDLEQFLSGKKKYFQWVHISLFVILLFLLGGYIWQQNGEADESTATRGTDDTALHAQTELSEQTKPSVDENDLPEQNEPSEQTKPTVDENDQPEQSEPPEQTTPAGDKNDPPEQNEPPQVKNNTWETAEELMLYDEFRDNNWHTWTIEDGEPHWWKFTALYEKCIYAIVVDCSVANPVNGQTVACLYDSEGNELETLSVGYGEKERFMEVAVERGKEYYIKITGVNGELPALGNYRLGLAEWGYWGDDPSAVVLSLDTCFSSSTCLGYIEEWYTFRVTKTGKYKIEICNHEDYTIGFEGDYGIKGEVGPGETVSITFNAKQKELFEITMFSRDDGATMDVPIGEYTLLVTYEGEILAWSDLQN